MDGDISGGQNDKNYLAIIRKKFGFLIRISRFFTFFAIVAYLFFLAMLIIDVSNTIQAIPDINEVNKRFKPIAAKKEIISSIENFHALKQKNNEKNAEDIDHNPFAAYKKSVINPADNAENPSVNAETPELLP